MDAKTFRQAEEKRLKTEEALQKIAQADKIHEERLLKSAFLGCQTLLQNGSFIDIMRLVFEFSNYDVNTLNQNMTQEEFIKLQGRREVWSLIRDNIIGNNPNALSLIENHKQINRQNNNV